MDAQTGFQRIGDCLLRLESSNPLRHPKPVPETDMDISTAIFVPDPPAELSACEPHPNGFALHSDDPEEGVHVDLWLRDRDVVNAINAHPEGRRRTDYIRTAIRIGVLALQQAQGRIDTESGRVEERRGCLGHAATPRFLLPAHAVARSGRRGARLFLRTSLSSLSHTAAFTPVRSFEVATLEPDPSTISAAETYPEVRGDQLQTLRAWLVLSIVVTWRASGTDRWDRYASLQGVRLLQATLFLGTMFPTIRWRCTGERAGR